MKLPIINGLRGIAILGVVWHHLWFSQFQYGYGPADVSQWVAALASSGWLGVSLFFFLSGFVLYLPYANGERSFGIPGSAKEFYRRRFARLMPLYTLVWVVSVVFVGAYSLTDPRLLGAVFVYATLYFPFNPATFLPPANWVLWSIGIEIWFSIFFPLLCLALRRIGWPAFVCAVLITALATRIAGHLLADVQGPHALLNWISDSVVGRLDDFVLGMLAAAWYARGYAPFRHAAWLAAGATLVALSIALWWAWSNAAVPVAAASLANLAFAAGLLMVVNHLLAADSHPLGKLLSVRALQMPGMACFSLYVWHGIVLLKLGPDQARTASGLLTYLALTGVLAALTYRYVEFGHVRRWRDLLPAAGPAPGIKPAPRAVESAP